MQVDATAVGLVFAAVGTVVVISARSPTADFHADRMFARTRAAMMRAPNGTSCVSGLAVRAPERTAKNERRSKGLRRDPKASLRCGEPAASPAAQRVDGGLAARET